MGHPKLWTKDFVVISLTNFFTHVVFYMLMATVAKYVTTEYNASASMAGISVGIFVIAALIARVFVGKYMDKIGRKRTLIWSMAVLVVSMVLHFGADSLFFLLIIRFIQGLSHGFITTSAGAVAADIIPDERRGEGTGYFITSMNTAMAIGPFLGIYISGQASFQSIILAGSIIAIIGFIVTLFLNVPNVAQHEDQVKENAGFHLSDFMEPKAVQISIVLFLVTLAYSSLLSFLSLYAEAIDLVEVASFFFIVYAAALVASRPVTGKWFDKYGANRVTYPLLICLSVGFLILSQAQNAFLFLLSAALIGIGYGTAQSNFQAIAIQQSPSNRKGLATSTFFIFLDLGSGLGPYILGIFAGMMSLKNLYLTMAIWIIICIGAYYLAHGKKVRTNRVMKNASRTG